LFSIFSLISLKTVSFAADKSVNFFPIATENDANPPCPISLEIKNITVSDITSTSAKISWETTTDSTGQVEYGLDTSYEEIYATATIGKSHFVTPGDLTANTTYHFRIRAHARGAPADEYVYSSDQTFKTLGSPQSIYIKSFTRCINSQTSATISWQLSFSVPAFVRMYYEDFSDPASGKLYKYIDSPVTTTSSVTFNSLLPGRNHWFSITGESYYIPPPSYTAPTLFKMPSSILTTPRSFRCGGTCTFDTNKKAILSHRENGSSEFRVMATGSHFSEYFDGGNTIWRLTNYQDDMDNLVFSNSYDGEKDIYYKYMNTTENYPYCTTWSLPSAQNQSSQTFSSTSYSTDASTLSFSADLDYESNKNSPIVLEWGTSPEKLNEKIEVPVQEDKDYKVNLPLKKARTYYYRIIYKNPMYENSITEKTDVNIIRYGSWLPRTVNDTSSTVWSWFQSGWKWITSKI
jgi:hypothetical protein